MASRTSKTSSGVLSGVGSSPFAIPRSRECPRPSAHHHRRCRRSRPAPWAAGRERRRSAPGRAPLPLGLRRRPTRSRPAGRPADPNHGSERRAPPGSAPAAAGSASGGRPRACQVTVGPSWSRRPHRAHPPTKWCLRPGWRTWAAADPPPASVRRAAASPGLAASGRPTPAVGLAAAAADLLPAVVA